MLGSASEILATSVTVVTIVSTIKKPALVLGADSLNTPISLWGTENMDKVQKG